MADPTRIDSRRVTTPSRALAAVPGKRTVHALIVGALVSLGVATSPATASAVPSITVTPNTGLNYFGQEVNITGTGWNPQDQGFPVEFHQCIEGTTTCAVTDRGPQSAGPDAGGGFSVTYWASPNTGGTYGPGSFPFDCRQTPCEVRARQYVFAASPPLEARAPIRFSPTICGVSCPGPGNDATDPEVDAKRTQKLNNLAVTVVPTEDGTVTAGGTVFVPNASKVYRFKKARKRAKAGQRVKLRLKLPKKARRAVKGALRHGKLTAEIRITATDTAGNRLSSLGKTIRLKRVRSRR